MKESLNVCYVRIPEMYRNYFRTKYGVPAVFAPYSPMQCLLRRHLINNPTLAKQQLTRAAMSYSDRAFNYATKGSAIDAQVSMPAPEEKEEFVAILIPSEATHYNTVVATSDTWQLTANGARSFRELVKEDFWCELSRFAEDCNYRARLAGEKVTREEILSDFITMYNVPMTCYENLLRYETRHRVSATTHIEKKRNALETQTGNRFMYT